jgi:hypothetical protein
MPFLINAAIYILATLGANYTATWFIPFPVFGQVAVGTFIFGLTFTQRDRLHAGGRGWVYGTIAVAAPGQCAHECAAGCARTHHWGQLFGHYAGGDGGYRGVSAAAALPPGWCGWRAATPFPCPLDTVLFSLVAFAGVLPPWEIASLVFGEIITKYAIGAIAALWKDGRFVWQTS